MIVAKLNNAVSTITYNTPNQLGMYDSEKLVYKKFLGWAVSNKRNRIYIPGILQVISKHHNREQFYP
jgi:hypothetical protein